MSKKKHPRQMCGTCLQAVAGLPDGQVVWRPTADLVKIGYPVPDPQACFTGVRVGDYRAFFEPPTQDAPQEPEQ